MADASEAKQPEQPDAPAQVDEAGDRAAAAGGSVKLQKRMVAIHAAYVGTGYKGERGGAIAAAASLASSQHNRALATCMGASMQEGGAAPTQRGSMHP